MIDISIIIPVYNVELHVERCVESIINQTFTGSYEIILVDDCSTDNSFSVLLALEAKYGKDIIKLVQHEENKKLSQARKTGFVNSKGKYIWNVDSDDWIANGSLQELFDITCENDVDVVLFNAYLQNNGGLCGIMDVSDIENGIYSIESFEKFQSYFIGAIWRKLIKRTLVDNDFELFKVSLNSSEDLLYGLELFVKIKNLYFTDKAYYNYYNNTNSITETSTYVELINNSPLLHEVMLRVLKKYLLIDKRIINNFSSISYSRFIHNLLMLRLKPNEFSKITEYTLNKTIIDLQVLLRTTRSKYVFEKQDLQIARLLRKNIKYFGFFFVIKKTISRLIK